MAERSEFIKDRSRVAHIAVESLVLTFADVGVDGRENLAYANERFKSGKPVIFAASHASNSDMPIAEHSFRMLGCSDLADRIAVVQGSSLSKHGLARWLMSGNRLIPIPSSRDERAKRRDPIAYRDGLEKGYRLAKHELEVGNPIFMFMGRGRNYDGKLEEVPSDIARWFQLVPNTEVIPVALVNTDKILKHKSLVPRFGRASVKFGTPVSVDSIVSGAVDPKQGDQMIVDEIMDQIASRLPEENRGFYSQPGSVRGGVAAS